MALAANALTEWATLQGELGLTDDTYKAVGERLINVASDLIEQACNRVFYRAAWTENVAVPAARPCRIVLAHTPLVSITSITPDNVPGPGTALDSTDFDLEDAAAGFVYRDARWSTTELRRPDVVQDYDPGSGKESLTVVYEGGYVTPAQVTANTYATRTLPYDLEQACLEVAVNLYRRRGASLEAIAEKVGEASVTYAPGGRGVLTPSVMQLIQRYARPL